MTKYQCDRCGKCVEKQYDLTELVKKFGDYQLCKGCFHDFTNMLNEIVLTPTSEYKEHREKLLMDRFRQTFTGPRKPVIIWYTYRSFWDWLSGNKTMDVKDV